MLNSNPEENKVNLTVVNQSKIKERLTADTGLSIHTKRAQSLCQGSWEYDQMGIFQFASLMHTIYQVKISGDSNADLYLTKVSNNLIKIKNEIEIVSTDYDKKVAEWRGLEIKVFGSRDPLKLVLHFSSPLGYMAAAIVWDLDYLLRQVYTFRKLGIMAESSKDANNLFWKFKNQLNTCRRWKS